MPGREGGEGEPPPRPTSGPAVEGGAEEERELSGRPVERPARLELQRIPLQRIRPRPDQPRRRIEIRALEELARSIRVHGVLQPIRVRPRGDDYEIVAGERRWRAAADAGLRDIPAIVVEADDDTAYVEALIENIQREELNAVDRAHALKRLRLTLNLRSWQEVGEVVGITRQHIYNLLNVTRLPEPIRDDIRAGDLTEKHARALLRLQHHPEEQRGLWERIHRDLLSGRAADAAARSIAAGLAPARTATERSAVAGLSTLVDATAAALAGATPAELSATRPALEALQRSLTEVLEGEGPVPDS